MTQKPGRPKTPTNKRSIKQVADSLEEDLVQHVKQLSRATGAKTSQENAQEPTSVARGWATHSP